MKRMISLLFSFVILHSTVYISYAATPAPVPQTGQTKCYNDSGTEVVCTGTGQDGEAQAGFPWPSPRFTTNIDQTVTDNLTSLIWSKDANPAGATKTWQEALNYIKTLNALNFLGYNDWRIPNISEINSLVNLQHSASATWLNTQGFSNLQPMYYWSGSTTGSHYYYSDAMIVDMVDGSVSSDSKGGKNYLWPVRSGQPGGFGSLILPKTGDRKSVV